MTPSNASPRAAMKAESPRPKPKLDPWSSPRFTKQETQALLFAATNNQGLENTGVEGGNEALAKLREALGA